MLPRCFFELILIEALFLLKRNTHLRLALIIEVDGLLAASGWVGNVQLVRVEGGERSPSVRLLRWTLKETTTCWVEGSVALKSVESCRMNPKRFASRFAAGGLCRVESSQQGWVPGCPGSDL